MAIVEEKPRLFTYSAAVKGFGLNEKAGIVTIATLVEAHGLKPLELGPRAKGLSLGDLAILAKALNKDLAAFA